MKISIGMNIQPGPWGGGNQFGRTLVDHLRKHDEEVSFDLNRRDLDIILLFDPRPTSQTATYSDREIQEYLIYENSSALVVHRINECDERKGTTGVNDVLMAANRIADHTVFISTWLKNLFVPRMAQRPHTVIRNGADRSLFHPGELPPWDGSGPLKLVTHHWGGNWMKGFDIYQRLDDLLGSSPYAERFAFTYIGNVPEGFEFKHSRYLPPMHGEALANALREHHVYLTASRNEPAGMHHIEGACCGLPLLYIESGALPEYCEGFGVSYEPDTFDAALEQMETTYNQWLARMPDYPYTAERMVSSYYQIFHQLMDQRDVILGRRTLPKVSGVRKTLHRLNKARRL